MTQLPQPRRPLLKQHSSTKTFSFFALIFCQFYVIYTYLNLANSILTTNKLIEDDVLCPEMVFWQTATVCIGMRRQNFLTCLLVIKSFNVNFRLIKLHNLLFTEKNGGTKPFSLSLNVVSSQIPLSGALWPRRGWSVVNYHLPRKGI